MSKSSILSKDNFELPKPINFCRFLSYNTKKENLYMALGTFGSVMAGLLLPSISMVMGEVTTAFGPG